MRSSFALFFLLICALPAPATAFVSKLTPYMTNGPIPCHQFKSSVVLYAQGKFTPQQLQTMLEREFLTPNGLSWSPADLTDNNNLLSLLNAQTHADPQVQVLRRESVAHLIEAVCAGAEQPYDEMNTPKKFRQLVGLPCNPQDVEGCP